MGEHAAHMPENVKGVMLSCIISDTLEFRSPTTTPVDKALAEKLAADLGIDLSAYASEMFEAKSDISAFSDAELLRMDSKEYAVGDTKFRVSVLETTAPKIVLDRKDSIMASMTDVAKEDGVDQVLLFVVDILNEEATMMIPNELTKTVAEASFGAAVAGDTVVLPGVMSRKKQIIPNLKTA
jgi:manganese-dependent inorganic pyrophosphatase